MCEEGQDRAGLMRLVRGGLAQLGALPLEGLGHRELARYQREVRGIADQAELLAAKGLAALDRLGEFRADGAADATSWLSQTCKLTPEAAQDRVTLARSLEKLKATANLLDHGELSFEQATIVARSAAKVADEDVERVEGMILGGALDGRAADLRRHAAAAVAEVDRDALARDTRRAREKRGFTIGPDIDGSARVSGDLTSECAAMVRAAMAPYLAPAGEDDPRSPQQRRHDALFEAAKRFVGGVHGREAGAPRPYQLVVMAPLTAMLHQPGPPALLQGLVPISQEELSMIACEADLSLVLKDKHGNIAFAGKSARSYSRAQRRTMVASQLHCAFKNCNRPAVDCVSHHLVEWCRGGQTTAGNDVALCALHHAMVHMDGWWVTPDDAGAFVTLPPGHPDNPKNRLTPADYLRLRGAAIGKRRRRRAKGGAAADP